MPLVERVDRGVVAVRADNPGPLTLEGTRTWLIGGDTVAVIDPGPDDPLHLDRIASEIADRPVAGVFLTHSHFDHAAAARTAADRWGPVHASAATLDRLDIAGVEIGDGTETCLDGTADRDAPRTLRALTTPGHSGDHLAFLILPSRDVITGDLILGRGSSMVAHPDGSVGAYLASLAKLASLRPGRLLPGHGPVVNDAAAKLREYADHRRERTDQVRAALDAGIGSMGALLTAVYGDLPAGVHEAAELSLRAHLKHLEDLGYDTSPMSEGITGRR